MRLKQKKTKAGRQYFVDKKGRIYPPNAINGLAKKEKARFDEKFKNLSEEALQNLLNDL